MNPIIKLALKGAAKTLLGSDVWDKIRGVVASLADQDMSGEEKRAAAKLALKEMGVNVLGMLINLGIEIAVNLLEAEIDKM